MAENMNAREAILKHELTSGETVLWCVPITDRATMQIGKNRTSCMVTLTVLALVLGAMIWAAGAGWIEWVVIAAFVIAGYVCIVWGSRIWLIKAQEAAYVITNKRALILAPVPQVVGPWQGKPRVVSIYPAELTKRTVVARNDGRGDIVFWQRRFVTALSESTFIESLSIRFADVPAEANVDALLTKVVSGEVSNAPIASDRTRCDDVGLHIGRLVP